MITIMGGIVLCDNNDMGGIVMCDNDHGDNDSIVMCDCHDNGMSVIVMCDNDHGWYCHV